MRLSQINEAIINRPRNLALFLTNRIKVLQKLIAEQERAHEILERADHEAEAMVRSFLRYGSDFADAADDVYLLARWTRPEYGIPLQKMARDLDSIRQYGANFIKFYLQTFDYMDKPWEDARTMAVLEILPLAEQGMEQYGFEPGKDYSDDEEFQAGLRYLEGARLIASVIIKTRDVWNDTAPRLAEMQKASGWGSDRYRPEHEDVEVLFHATAYASEIAQNGFSAEKPDGRQGVGNYGDQTTISFTHDLKIAHDIARCLKEIWMIAHGQLTAKQIVSWIRHEGIDKEYPNLAQTVGIAEVIPNEDPRYANYPRHRLKQITELKGEAETLKLYNTYLWLSKIRTNPVFANPDKTLELMKSRKIDDIGVVACEVELSSETEYMVGEKEFRVTPDKVKSVKRVY